MANDLIYHSIPNTKNILSTLINNINKDEIFQKNVNRLSNSNNVNDVKKADIIKKTIQNIKVYNTKNNPLFLAKDIGILLGISAINIVVKKFEKEEKIIGYINDNYKKCKKIKKVVFLTKYGLYRCFYTSKSPLANLFRKYLSDLLDYMFTYERNLLDKISKKFQTENEELIEKGLNDLCDKLNDYEKIISEEKAKVLLLENKLEEERDIIIKKDQEITEIDTINNFNMMMIKQLQIEKENNIKRIKNIKSSIVLDDFIDNTELKMIKEKYMKPVQIYLLHPDYFLKLLEKQKKHIIKTESSIIKSNDIYKELDLELGLDRTSSEKPTKNNKDISVLEFLINDIESYKNNFNYIFGNLSLINKVQDNELIQSNLIQIDKDELLYFYFTFGKKVLNSNDIYLVDTKWVIDKKHMDRVLNTLSDDMSYLKLDKALYKTSINEIDEVIKEEFLTE